MKFFPGTNTDDFDIGFRRDGMSQINHLHTWDLGDKYLAALHFLNTTDNKFHTLIKGYPETGHPVISKGYLPILPLLDKQRHDTSPGPNHIAIPDAAEPSFHPTRVSVALNH